MTRLIALKLKRKAINKKKGNKKDGEIKKVLEFPIEFQGLLPLIWTNAAIT